MDTEMQSLCLSRNRVHGGVGGGEGQFEHAGGLWAMQNWACLIYDDSNMLAIVKLASLHVLTFSL